ncbi:hypothetical protein FKW77_000148 [Venturia effusa]|uniref:Uncharacterized protein n=1 Tax=Venturia effusa TaxID=50376 RepID=A0A517LA53_9PEZI|nr:hypothetical protein FKW77_000148 [Venturia effusa]
MEDPEVIQVSSHESAHASSHEERGLAELSLEELARLVDGLPSPANDKGKGRATEEEDGREEEAGDARAAQLDSELLEDGGGVLEGAQSGGQVGERRGNLGISPGNPKDALNSAKRSISLAKGVKVDEVPGSKMAGQIEDMEKAIEVFRNPEKGPRLIHPEQLPIEDFPMPGRSWLGTYLDARSKTLSFLRRHIGSPFIYHVTGVARVIVEEDQRPHWRCYAPCDEKVIGWQCPGCNKDYMDRDNCHLCKKEIRAHPWRRGIFPPEEEERLIEREEWEKEYDDWNKKCNDGELIECAQGWYRCLTCKRLATAAVKAEREDAADLGYHCKACADKDLDVEQKVLTSNLVKHRKMRLKQHGFIVRDHVEVELPGDKDMRLMKALRDRNIEPGFSRKADAKGRKQVCWCPGYRCDVWGENIREWENTNWPCPGPPHLDPDERINPHKADWEAQYHREYNKLKREQREKTAKGRGMTLEQLMHAKMEMTTAQEDEIDQAEEEAINKVIIKISDYKRKLPRFAEMVYWHILEEAPKKAS